MINKLMRRNFFKSRSAVFWISFVCVVMYVLIFILNLLFCSNLECNFVSYVALMPDNLLSGNYLWTIVTHIFMHGGIFHLFVNLFVLFSIGGFTERIIGRKRFLWFFLLSGIFAGIASVLLAGFFGFGFWEGVFGNKETYMVGASGAIFGLAGLLVVLLPRLRFSIIFLPFFSLPAYIMVPLVLIATWAISILAGLPIGNVAHAAGFLSGLVYGWYLKNKYQKKVMVLQRMFK